MAHQHLCLHCDILIAEGEFDCEYDEDHDFALCENCAPECSVWDEYQPATAQEIFL